MTGKVIFLDEPTSGMDPFSRRYTWGVIKNHREGHVIIFTTHFMVCITCTFEYLQERESELSNELMQSISVLMVLNFNCRTRPIYWVTVLPSCLMECCGAVVLLYF